VCNTSTIAETASITDADCGFNNQSLGTIPAGQCIDVACTSSDKPNSTTIVNTGGTVAATANECTDTQTVPSASCPIPGCPCSVIIEKTVAPDDGSGVGNTACDGIPDGAFVESVTVDQNACVVYNICVTNTAPLADGQTLNGAGVTVSDAHLGIVNFNFGTIVPGQEVCKLVASEITTATQCPNGTCICSAVEGQNTAVVSSAICVTTQDNACIQPGSDCEDTANVACIVPITGCRMTGGHVAMANVDSTFDDPESGTHYSTGGQIGAPNDSGCCNLPPKGKCVAGFCTGGLNGGDPCTTNDNCPNDPGRNSSCPWGDWEHNHHSGPDDCGSVTGGSFAFHSGTAAAPDSAFIKSIICADPGWCVQARPAPDKQIFWEGTGVFHNTKGKKNLDIPLPNFSACAVQPKPWSNKAEGTLHYYRAHVGDFGEPAGIRQKPADGCTWFNECGTEPCGEVGIESCQPTQEVCLIERTVNDKVTALHPLCEAQNCSECPDWYEIEIHCTESPASPVAYRVAHHITEGNFQLHPSVGDSCQPCGDGLCQAEFDETCLSCPEDCGPCIN
jgi:hypothetical protein